MVSSKRTILLVLLAVSLSLIGVRGGNMAHAQNAEDTDRYSKNYINRMFTELEPVMVFDENKHLSLNHTAAEYYGLSLYDMEFGEQYIAVHNNLMDTIAAGGNVTEALLPITEGKFSGIFDDTKRAKRGFYDSTACGGHNLSNPHPPLSENITKKGYTKSMLQNHAVSLGYHLVYFPASGDLIAGNDYGKKQTRNSPGDCNDSEFREQFYIRKDKSSTYKHSWDEPNPELLEYDAPTYWWNSYVAWWHLRN